MDVMAIIFCAFGWGFHNKGLIITAMVFSIILLILQIVKLTISDLKGKKLKQSQIESVVDFAIMGFCIVFFII